MKEEYELFHSFLKKQGMNFTSVRQAILDTLCEQESHFTVRDILPRVKVKNIAVNRASLYRNIHLLKLAGLLEEVPPAERSGRGCFRMVRRRPRRCILFCPGCHIAEQIADDEFDRALVRLCERFRLDPDTLQVRIEARHLCGRHPQNH